MGGDIQFITRSSCELCGTDNKTILRSISLSDAPVLDFLESYYQGRVMKSILNGAKYELAKCRMCGFIWQTRILNDQGMRKLYGEWISADESLKKKKTADLSMFSGYARQVEVIPSLLRRKYPAELIVVDYGMGWGYWCLMAKAFGLNVKGIELSVDRTDFGQKNGIEVVDDPKKLAPGSLHFINAEQVFEHIPKPRETLDALVHSLVAGGVIRMSVPNGRRVETRVRNPAWKAAKDAAHPLEHINIFTNRSLRRLGQSAGLHVINHPFLLWGRRGIKSRLRGIVGKYYNQYFGTTMYFRKPT